MGDGDRALLRARGDQHRHLARDRREAGLEVVLTGQRGEFAFVDEQDVDHAVLDHRAEIVTVTVDHEAFGRGEGDLATRLARDLDGAAHGAAGLFGVPQIAFEIEDRSRGDQVLVHGGGWQELARAEEGVHGALAIGRHEDQHAAGGGLAVAAGRVEVDAGGAHIVAEYLAELVVGDLADESALQAERCEPRQRVGRRAARDLARGRHGFVKLVGARLVDQGHAAAVELKLGDQLLLAGGDHVDHGVADGDDVVTGLSGLGHGRLPWMVDCASA